MKYSTRKTRARYFLVQSRIGPDIIAKMHAQWSDGCPGLVFIEPAPDDFEAAVARVEFLNKGRGHPVAAK